MVTTSLQTFTEKKIEYVVARMIESYSKSSFCALQTMHCCTCHSCVKSALSFVLRLKPE